MAQDRAGEQIVERIGFAERWLDRARAQIGGGNMARGALTLVLADAEVRHALEVAGLRSRHRPRRAATAAVAVALLLVAAGAVLVLALRGGDPAVFSADSAPPVVTLGPRTGSLLTLIQAPRPAVPVPAVRSAPARVLRAAPAPTPAPQLSVRPRVRPAPVTVAPAPAAPLAPAATPEAVTVVPPAVQPPSLTLTAGELIDLVLAAERALRGDGGP